MAHCFGSGRWHVIGELAIDSDPESIETRILRHRMGKLGKFSVISRLVLPESIIWYTSCEVSGPDPQDHVRQVRDFLHSAMPVEVRELSIDWYIDGGVARIAYVENHNLKVAEEFAVRRRFNPVEFVALPTDPAVFGRIAGFGLTEFAIRRGIYADDRRTAPLPASPARAGQTGTAHASVDTSIGKKARRPAGILSAAVLGSLLALLSPADNLAASPQGGQTAFPTLASDIGQSTGGNKVEQVAGLLDGSTATVRPLRRPDSDSVNSGTASTPDNFESPKLGNSLTSTTFSYADMIEWQNSRVTAGNELDDRGFDPRTVSFPVLNRYRIGLGDNSQAELLAHIRSTVGLTQELVFSEPEVAPPVEPAADTSPEQQILATVLPSRGLTESSVGVALTRLLDSHDRSDITSDISAEPQNLPAAPSGLFIAGLDAYMGGLEGRAEDSLAALPDGQATTAPSGFNRPVRRPVSAVETALVVTNSFEIAFDRPVRRGRFIDVAPVEQPAVDTRVASLSSQPNETGASTPFTSNVVVSLANETLEIVETETRLIGIFGQDRGSLRALVRLGSGNFESIYRGSELEGGRVVEIRRDSVVYERDSERYLLTFVD